ncbi:MAG TPA: DinB family protein [Acidimicrobiales bacterium]
MVQDLEDTRRQEPSFVLDERQMLEAWLEYHRTTLLLKCEGLDDAGRKARPVPSSLLSLHGLVRHMAEVERGWFRRVLLSQPDTPPIWYDEAIEDSELVPLDDADWQTDLRTWQDECEASRAAAAGLALDHTGTHRDGPCSLRWIYTHMIEEYARHNGHADLIRELVDGQVGC